MKKEKVYELIFNLLFVLFAVCLLITFVQTFEFSVWVGIAYVLSLLVYTLISNSIYQYLIDYKLNK